MGLPTTFAGLIGFIILSGYLIADVMDDNASSDAISDTVNTMQSNLNTSLSTVESSGGFSGFFSMLGSIIQFGWSLVLLALNSISTFVQIPLQRGLPSEMYIVFSLVIIFFISATVKWIWSGE